MTSLWNKRPGPSGRIHPAALEGQEQLRQGRISRREFLRLATGHLSAVTGVLRGQLKVRGDKAKALQLSSVIDFPKAR